MQPKTMNLPRLLAACALLLPGLVSAAEWTVCASEGQVCRVSGEAMVRFGANDKFAFRRSNGDLECSVQSFGQDPAYGYAKRCEVSQDWRRDPGYHGWRHAGSVSDGWRSCAPEGGSCQVPAGAQVRFGVDGRYATRSMSGTVRCDVRTFGDPAPGVYKVCEVSETGQWAHCANEGEYCRVPGPTTVRYGLGANLVERQVNDGIACNNSSFRDPAPGYAKQCAYRVSGGGNDQAGYFAPAPTRSGGLDWRACASEGGVCELGGPAMLRYGANGRYAYREAEGRLACNNREFGVDPAPGASKVCERLYPR
jgi:hypothetical protein